MGKQVKVIFTAKGQTYTGRVVTRDMTAGETYKGYLPDVGEKDPDGLEVAYVDELWIESDDVGETVVTRLSEGFTLA